MSTIKSEIFDIGVSATGLTYSMYYIKETLGLIVLILTIANILIKLVSAIINKIKNKDIKGVTEDIESAKNELEDIKENINEEDWKNGFFRKAYFLLFGVIKR